MNNNKRKPLVAGNWKMNGNRSLVTNFNDALTIDVIGNVDVVICPPALYLSAFCAEAFALGGQDVSHLDNGAHTGDLSADMLAELGCRYAIVGHSERRDDHGESNSLVAEKAKKSIASGLTPIICVGESLDIRESGQVESFIGEQLDALINGLTVEELSKSVLAYEPVWAIGTGKTASPEQAQDVHEFIRGYFAKVDAELAQGLRILYGGSVKADNAKTLFAQQDVDGGLIGGASLKTEDFISICQAAN
ncbi:triose-phosphate isomerase [Alteromonas sp. KS69]|uniref:triose-phosphate isomerase n=1 Tax=Alteromonas sp. KS69 TaxID=2109917 RepID=UPI000C0EEFE2|nr:triose-phosphate isomerase [Alteromonas sp. KS69]MBB66672.1 triose-phosphate isomerase [Rickettsiales bacterium]PHS53110.1 MAG: triose-phosphate isomerase [Alteromonas sp.]RUP81980.1 triose-phosphate isomerase [Alteromonas sp. KS69]